MTSFFFKIIIYGSVQLAKSGDFNYLVVESTGISEPMPVAETFAIEFDDGYTLSNVAVLDTMVTVVDAKNFLSEWVRADELQERNMAVDESDQRTVSDLLASQVEFANVILLNKADLVSEKELDQIENILRELNPSARLIRTTKAKVPMKEILNTGLFDFDEACQSPGWLQVLNSEEPIPHTHSHSHSDSESHSHPHIHSRNSEAEQLGISSFVFRQRRPFHPERLWGFITQQLTKVIRSKGFFWLASRNDEMGIWSQAGGSFTPEQGGKWWVVASEDDWPEDQEDKESIRRDFEGVYGDRRQELVFIGRKIEQVALEKELAACLLTDKEMEAGPKAWAKYKDPFPSWTDELES